MFSRPTRWLIALLAASAALGAVPAATGAADPEAGSLPSAGADPVGSRVIVQWRQSADRTEKTAARESADVDYEAQLGMPRFQLVTIEPGQSVAAAVRELEADPAVAVAEPDGYRTLDAVPNDPLFPQLWGLRNTGAGVNGFTGAIAGADVNAVAAWDRSVGTPTTVVADIDSGYRFDDPDLGPVAWTNPGETAGNGIDDDGNGYIDDVHGFDFVGTNASSPGEDADPTDDNLVSGGHGLHTAGTIGAAGNDGVGITGVARDARIMPLRVCANQPSSNETRCPFSSILAAINYAGEMGARAANLSLGGNTFTQTEVNAIAAHPETLYVISAGNDGGDNDGGGAAPKGHHYPCDYRPTLDASPAVPGAIDNVVCVAATDQADQLAGYSDYGATSVDLGAPGSSVLSTYPTIQSWMADDFETDDFGTEWLPYGAGFGRAAAGDGPLTSFGMTDTPGAAPEANHVYGVESTTETALPAGTGSCRIKGMRHRKGGSLAYGLFLDGNPAEAREFLSSETVGSAMVFFQTVPILGLGGHSLQMFFEYGADSTPIPTEGAWLDDLRLECYAPAATPLSHAFLDGTSMAAPHVTGAAALLFSLEPSATVTEVRDALLAGIDSVPSLTGKTVTGGRLNIAKAMDSLEGTPVDQVPPSKPVLTGTSPESGSNDNHPRILGSAEAGGTVTIFKGTTCTGAVLANGSASELNGAGIEVTVPDNSITFFSASATDAARNRSTCSLPGSYLEDSPEEEQPEEPGGGGTVIVIPTTGSPSTSTPTPPGPPSCVVPKLAGKSLGQAKSALAAAGCRLGRVSKPKSKKGRKPPKLVVKSSTPGAGSSTGGAVNLKLGPKPKKRHH